MKDNIEERDLRFDYFKGILIFLVVFGHLIGEFKERELTHVIWRCIYLFHMPAFAFISGYFYKEKKDYAKTLLVPLLLFSVFYEVIHVIIFRGFSFSSVQLIPYWILWYLLSLFFWRSIYFYIKNIKFILGFSVLIGLLAGLSENIVYTLSISRTLVFFPYFIWGNKIKSKKLFKESYSIIQKIAAGFVLVTSFIFFSLFCKNIPDKLLNGSYCYKLMNIKGLYGGGTEL